MTKRNRFLSLAQFKALPRDANGNIINLLEYSCRFKDVYFHHLTKHDLDLIIDHAENVVKYAEDILWEIY